MRTLLVLAASAALLSGCGQSLSGACRRSARVSCHKIFECLPGQAAVLGYTSEADCVTKTATQTSCDVYDTLECPGLKPGDYNACVDAVERMSCAALTTSAGTPPAECQTFYAQAQNPMCTSTDGTVFCSSAGATSSGTTCSRAHSGCADGKAYAMSCAGGTCTCTVTGQLGTTFAGSACTVEAANAGCGWKLR